jgi:hypothetical protein
MKELKLGKFKVSYTEQDLISCSVNELVIYFVEKLQPEVFKKIQDFVINNKPSMESNTDEE